MVRTTCFISIILTLCATGSPALEWRIISTSEELEALFEDPVDSVNVRLLPGTYHLNPTYQIESTCGNCEEIHQNVFFSVGLQISGKHVRITGPEDRSATLVTHAGYGLYFVDCEDCTIEGLDVTGGIRDADVKATDAAIVVKNGSVQVIDCRIYDNIGDSSIVTKTVSGIMGICGRENSRITIRGNRITRNSWDGIALYRDAEAIITHNVIDGVDKARGKAVGGGRGVGIGVTWNARARIEYNLVKRYWKGIGLFVDAEADVRKNVVEDILTWGIALWDAGKGRPVGRFQENVIFKTGACGASITRFVPGDEPGYFRENIIARTGTDPRYDSPEHYCYQCAIAKHAVPKNFQIEENSCYNNRRATDDLPDYDIPKIEFRKAILPLCEELSGIESLRSSEFLLKFCGEGGKFNLFEHLFQKEDEKEKRNE